ncbi:MAG: hypothetical protein NC314_03170 [Roseburia sp.]|nr:hypothetical protein [Roseburia sp.]MCM1241814.1 hypothetical protein [Roseburia sp.]
MSKKVIELLKKHGPMLSGDLARLFEKEYGVSNTAARQALSRARPPVNKICTLSFEKNQKFFYLESQFMSQKYMEGLLTAIQENSQVNWIYICAFQAQRGYVSKSILPALVSSPVKNVKGHKLHRRVIEDLLSCHMIEEYDDTRWKLSDWVPATSQNLPSSTGIEVVKKQIVHDFASWARNLNLVGYESTKTIFEDAQFANFQWAFTAPSYVQPLYNIEQQKNGFIVADVFYGRTADLEDIQFFLNKISIIRNYKKLPSFLPVLLLENATPEALKALKEQKVVVAFIKNLFDQRYVELLAQIVTVFTNASAIVSKDPDQIEKLFAEIARSEGRYNDIIGDFFEIMVGYYYQSIGIRYLTIGKTIHIPNSDKTNEIDLLVEREGKIIVVECKATRSATDEKYVEKWLNKNIPQIRKWLLDRYPDIWNYEFQIWSLGGFTKEAQDMLQKAGENTGKYKIESFDKEQILKMVQEKKVQHIADLLREYF